MRNHLPAMFAIALIASMAVALAPHELVATKTVGHQGRAQRARRIEAKPERTEPRICAEGEISTDRDPCIGSNGRLDYLQ